MRRIEVIGCLRLAVDLAGDNGFHPFTDEQYKAMTELINELLEQEYKNNEKQD